jgi:hypothetical protein
VKKGSRYLMGQTGLWTVACLCLMSCAATAVRADSDVEADMYLVEWQASAWAGKVAGSACWLLGSENDLRAEISLDDSSDPESFPERLRRLLHRQGGGWTVTWAGGREGSGTLQPWGEAWRVAEPRLMIWLHLLTSALVRGPALELNARRGEAVRILPVQRVANRPRWLTHHSGAEFPDDKLQVQIPSPPARAWSPTAVESRQDVTTAFQAAMVHRGLGRGADQEIVTLQWERQEAEAGPDRVRVRSSRRPGQLNISLPQVIPVRYPVPESFLPLWSLADLAVEIPVGDNEKKSDGKPRLR